MKDKTFLDSLQVIMSFIAIDSLDKALSFDLKLRANLNTLDNFPYKFRKSIYFNNDNIRDYIFMGYAIPYFVDIANDKIIILDILKYKDT